MRIFHIFLHLSVLLLLVCAKRQRPVAAHRLVIEHRPARKAPQRQLAVKPNSKTIIVQPDFDDPSQNHSDVIQTSSRGTCPVTPFDFAQHLPGCLTMADIFLKAAGAGAASLKDSATNKMNLAGVSDSNTKDIDQKVLTPIMDSLLGLVEKALDSDEAPDFLESNICTGNFKGDYEFSDYEGVCQDLPLNEDLSWTVFGFAVDVGVLSPFHSFCPGATADSSTFASFCMAIAKDCNYLPSFVFSVTPVLFKCQPFDSALAASSAGASKVVTETLSVALESYTFGISVTNSFTRTFTIFSGSDIVDFTAPGALYSSGKFAISTDAIPNVPEFFAFGGEAVKMISISGVSDGVNKAISELKKAPKEGPEKALTAVKKLARSLDFALLYNIKLTLKFEFSKIPKLGSVLPDSEEFEIGEASLYATTGSVTSGSDVLKPGMYMYTSGNIGNILKELLRYALKFAGEILNSLPDWIPIGLIDFDASQLADKIKTNGNADDFGVGFATIVPNVQAVILLRAPLIISELGFVELKCTIDLDDAKFKCSVKFKGISKFFAAIGEALEEGVLWVAKQLANFGQDFADAAEEVLLAGLSAVGDALGEAFSLKSISKTLDMLEDGLINLSGLKDLGNAIAAWGTEAVGTFLDVMDDIGEGLEDGIKEIGEFGEKVIDDLGSIFSSSDKSFNDIAQELGNALGCNKDNTKKAIELVCRSCCSPAFDMEKELQKFGNKIEDAVEDIIEDVGEFFENGFNDFLKATGILKTSSSIKEYSTSKIDPTTKCRLYKYVEKRTKTYKILWVKKTKTTYHDLYIVPRKSCVEERLQKTKDAKSLLDTRDTVKGIKEKAERDLKSSLTATGISLSKLLSKGLKCESTFDRANGKEKTINTRRLVRIKLWPPKFKVVTKTTKKYVIPTTITCKSPEIKSDGSIGGLYTVTVTKDMEMSPTSQDLMRDQLATMEMDARNKLKALITANVAKTYNVVGLPSKFKWPS